MKSLGIPLIVGISFITLGFTLRQPNSTAVLTEYQHNVITHFKEIALGFEFGTDARITRKWATTIKLYMSGHPSTEIYQELYAVIDELNELTGEQVTINIVDSRAEANLHVFVGSSETFGLLYSNDAKLAKENSGMYHIYWNKRNEITRGQIFVKTTNISLQEQRHVLREEITQALGLGRDSDLFPESIFRSSYVTHTQYAPIDREIIRLLYHPRMPIGATAEEAESIITSILLDENVLTEL